MTRLEIVKWMDQAAVVTAEAKRMRDQYSPDQLNWKPSASEWSLSEVFGHLAETNESYFPKLEQLIASKAASGENAGNEKPYGRSWFARWFIGLLEPTSEKKLKAPSKFAGTQSTLDRLTLDRFIESQAGLESSLLAANTVELGGARFGSPITPLIRFTLGEGLDLLVTHERRHLQQAQRVEKSLPTPKVTRTIGSNPEEEVNT